MNLTELLRQLMNGADLSAHDAGALMAAIMTGEAGEARTAALLTALAIKGETAAEIEGCARSMRSAALSWSGLAPELLLDTCGTGGDRSGTLNISTLAALTIAAIGIPVAKHGNRAVSSSTGSADLLEELGVRLAMDPAESARCLEQNRICFLFAQAWHPAMKHAAPVRKALGVRTVFNLLGPLTNPAPITHQVVGVFDGAFAPAMAEALAALGRKGACVVYAQDGLDEVSPAAKTAFIRIENGAIRERGTLQPADFGLKEYPLDQIRPSDRAAALARTRAILSGNGSDAENATVAMNAGLALHVAGHQTTLSEAAALAMESLRSGAAMQTLQNWSAQ